MQTTEPICVLVADDDEDIRASVRLLLEDEGYGVAESADGASTLRALCAAPAGLVVLLDLTLRLGDGLTLAAILADPDLTRQHVYELFTAARLDTTVTSRLATTSVPLRVMRKPFDADELLRVLAQAASHHTCGSSDGMPATHLAEGEPADT